MKRIFNLTATFAMLAIMMLATSCSTTKSVNKSFEKNGYIMSGLTPGQQVEIAPVLNGFPSFGQSAIGYLVTGNATTFVYEADEITWNNYCAKLENAGFSNMGTGFVKADKNAGITYNVSGKFTTVYKRTYLLVTYTHGNF